MEEVHSDPRKSIEPNTLLILLTVRGAILRGQLHADTRTIWSSDMSLVDVRLEENSESERRLATTAAES